MDARDGAKYTVQVVHSAPMLLSMILVYGKDQRLLAMAHLIGADSLPAKDQLDPNLVRSPLPLSSPPPPSYSNRLIFIFQQFLPHLSSPEERAMVIVNKDGDCTDSSIIIIFLLILTS